MCPSAEQLERARRDHEEADRLMEARRRWITVMAAYKGYNYDAVWDERNDHERARVFTHYARSWDGRHSFTIPGPDAEELTQEQFRAAVDRHLEDA